MKNKRIIFVFIFLLVIIFSVMVIVFNQGKEVGVTDNVYLKKHNGNDYYIFKDDYEGEYDIQIKEILDNNESINFINKKEIMSYDDYEKYCNKVNVTQKYYDKNKEYIVISYLQKQSVRLEARLAGIEYNNTNVNLYIWDKDYGIGGADIFYAIIIPLERDINDFNIVSVITEEEYNDKINDRGNSYIQEDWKPIIYLYPTEETEVEVKLINDYLLTTSYPKYENNWNVLAYPNGDLIDLKTNRNLYALYYENEMLYNMEITNDGFVIKGEDTVKFLEEKLAVLGLNDREIEEFIIYWLPKMEENKYNYIRFATEEEINNNMPIEVSPKPDTIIRILMTFKGLEEPIEVKEQTLVAPIRNGFTLVEWGGTIIK